MAKPATVTPTKEFDQWELDARLLQTASEEGMGGGEPSLLDEVKQALATHGAAKADGHGPTGDVVSC